MLRFHATDGSEEDDDDDNDNDEGETAPTDER